MVIYTEPLRDVLLDSSVEASEILCVSDTVTATGTISATNQDASALPQLPPCETQRRPRSNSPVRKRSRNELMWKRNINKTLKNSGQPYISSRGKHCEGAKMRDPCSCKFDCRHRIEEEERHQIHCTFWELGSRSRQ